MALPGAGVVGERGLARTLAVQRRADGAMREGKCAGSSASTDEPGAIWPGLREVIIGPDGGGDRRHAG